MSDEFDHAAFFAEMREWSALLDAQDFPPEISRLPEMAAKLPAEDAFGPTWRMVSVSPNGESSMRRYQIVYLTQLFHHRTERTHDGQPCSIEVTVYIYHDIRDALAWMGNLTTDAEHSKSIGHWEQGLLVNLWPLCYAYPTEGFDRRRLTVAFLADRCVWSFSSESGAVMHYARRHFEKLTGSTEALFAENDTLDRMWPSASVSHEGVAHGS